MPSDDEPLVPDTDTPLQPGELGDLSVEEEDAMEVDAQEIDQPPYPPDGDDQDAEALPEGEEPPESEEGDSDG